MIHRRTTMGCALVLALSIASCALEDGDETMAEYTGGEPTGLTVVRTGQGEVQISLTVPDDGLGEGAGIEVRGADQSLGEWWWGDVAEAPLVQIEHGAVAPGSPVKAIAGTGLDLDGRTMRFAVVAYRFDEETGKNVFSRVVPDDRIGLEVEFGLWADEPDPEPEPDPVVRQAFSVQTPVAGDDGLHVQLVWEELDAATFIVDGDSAFKTPAGEPGEGDVKFLPLDRELLEGELVTIYSVGHLEDRDSLPWPEPALELRVEAELVEPDPGPEPEPEDNPIAMVELMEGESDSMIVTWADGSRAEIRRFSPWAGVFDWLMGSVWLARKLPPGESA